MKKIGIKILSILFIAICSFGFSLVQYNPLNISGIDDTWVDEREDYLETVFTTLAPDILVVQEIFDESGADFILDKLRMTYADYERAEFIDGEDSDNMIYYRSRMFSLTGQITIRTELRDISGYVLQVGDEEIYFFSAHLKASSGSSNANQREREADALCDYIQDHLSDDALYVLCGDLNLYSGSEDAYELLTDRRHGDFIDPLRNDSEWHNNESVAEIHTQSTRTENIYGGSTGGLDDRFDFILISRSLDDGTGVEIIDGSYETIGNDGEHYDRAVNQSPFPEGREMMMALYHASDHLPVRCEFTDPENISEKAASPDRIGFHVYPNPFNSTCTLSETHDYVEIWDLSGNRIDTLIKTSTWKPSGDIGSGVYIINIPGSGIQEKILYIK